MDSLCQDTASTQTLTEGGQQDDFCKTQMAAGVLLRLASGVHMASASRAGRFGSLTYMMKL
jgi:hypothetical protein